MGYIEKLPSGRYRGVVRLPNGSRRSQTCDYAYEAEAWMLEAEERIGAFGPLPAQPVDQKRRRKPLTVTAHAETWIERRRGHIERATVDCYSAAIRGIAAGSIGAARIDVLRRSDVETWVTQMADAGVGRPTQRIRIKVLRMVCRDALAERLADFDPTDGIRLPPVALKTDRVLDRKGEKKLLDVAGPELRAFVLLCIDAGLRWQEAAGLPVDAVNLDRGDLTVRQVVERGGRIRKDTKSHRERRVPLTDRTVAALRPLLRQARLHRGHDGLVFVNQAGRHLDYHDWRRDVWAPAMTAADIRPRPTPHGLRHTYGSRLAAASVPRSEIAELMGHADEKTTARYVHVGDGRRRAQLVRSALSA